MKNLIIVVLALLAIGEGYLLYKNYSNKPKSEATETTSSAKPSPAPRIPFLTKGMKLADWPMSKFAYQIAPGDLSVGAQSALSGWTIKSTSQSDGSLLVSLTPKTSDDQSQQYTVKKGEILYFVEMTPVDDKDVNTDTNLRDDYGVITDAQGIVQ